MKDGTYKESKPNRKLEAAPIKGKSANNKMNIEDCELYPSQKEALDKLYTWYKSDDLFCVLEGFAGTGKTFILKYFIKNVIDKSWTVSAPTHKALRVLSEHIGYNGMTIHSLLGLRPNIDLANFDPTNPQFAQINALKIDNYHIVILDECSMVNTGLFNRLIKTASNLKIKILFVGDSLQLPPVKEKLSPTFRIKNKVVLNTIVRQEAGNPLLELFSLIRYDIVHNTSSFLNHVVNNKVSMRDNIGYELLPVGEFKERCLNIITGENFVGNKSKGINPNIDHMRILSYTNNAVSMWNRYIRDNFLGDDIPLIHINDLFTSYNTILNEFGEPIILNSEDYIIYDLRNYVSDEGIKTFAVNLQSMYDNRKTDPFLIVDHNDKSYAMYCKLLQVLYHNGLRNKEGGWKTYYNFKNRFLTLVPLTLVDLYGNERVIKKDLDYGFGLSVHKSQGSTFNNVAIDLTDIVWKKHANGGRSLYETSMRNRLIYVALSRARHSAILKY